MDLIHIQINGQPQTIPPDSSVTAVLAHLAVNADRVAVELNKSLVRKRDWSGTIVPPGAHMEIVEFVGGG